MARRDVPEPWAAILIRAGLTDPRYDKRPSMTQLADEAGVHASTVGHAMYGTRQTTAETANKLAIAIARKLPAADKNKIRRQVLGLINEAMGQSTAFTPHPDADLLDNDEQKVVNDLIGLLVRSRRRQAGEPERALYLVDEAAYEPDPDDVPGKE